MENVLRDQVSVEGIRVHLGRHAQLLAATVFVAAMVGVERTIVPLLAEDSFGIESATVALSFIASFGAVKAFANFFAGRAADRVGRKRTLVTGWLLGIPVPFMVMFAPNWGWVVAANLLLGANQGFVWTMTLVMMSDLAGDRRRGTALGANEFAGYSAQAAAAWGAGALGAAFGLRPAPLVIGAIAAALGLGLSAAIRDTGSVVGSGGQDVPPRRLIFPGRHRRAPALRACYQAGLITKLNDVGVWGLLPLFLRDQGFSIYQVGIVAAAYPLAWAFLQLWTGAASDRFGRKRLIVAGMTLQGIGVLMLPWASSLPSALVGVVILGLGTALVYPTLLACVGDLASGLWRASVMGAYRFWRDLGLVAGALGLGALVDALGFGPGLRIGSVFSFLAAAVIAVKLPETHRRPEPEFKTQLFGQFAPIGPAPK